MLRVCYKPVFLCLCDAFFAPSLRWSGPAIIASPDGTSFNIQNPIPHPSQKEKVLLETRRAKECQRGIAGAAERAKEGGRVPFESSDTRLGCRGWVFKSPHSDQNPSEIIDFRGIFLILCLLRHRRRACHSQHIFSTGADLIL